MHRGREEAAALGTESTMSEFDKLKDDAEQYGQQHPQPVQEGEQDVEKKFGFGGGQQFAVGLCPGPGGAETSGARQQRAQDGAVVFHR